MVQEFRIQRLSTNSGDDVINLYLTLQLAWIWLCQELDNESGGQVGDSVGDEDISNSASFEPYMARIDGCQELDRQCAGQVEDSVGGEVASGFASFDYHTAEVDGRQELESRCEGPVGESVSDGDISTLAAFGSSSARVDGQIFAPAASHMHRDRASGSDRKPRSARRKEKRKAAQAAKAFGVRCDQPGHNFDCPLCLGKFHRSGLFDHL